MEGGASEPVEARHHECIPLPDIVQAGTQLGAWARRTAVGLLKEFVTVLQLLALDVQTLPDRTHPCIPYREHQKPGGGPAVWRSMSAPPGVPSTGGQLP